jgi:uncharacterized iron-regulated membrane protein
VQTKGRWFSVHRWLGIVLGLWFALVGLTGAILVYEEPLDAWLNPQLLTTASRGARLAPEAIIERARSLGHVERIRLPQAEGEVYRLLLRSLPQRRIGNPRIEAMFDPVSGALHRNVLLGEPGSNIVGVAGTLLLVSAISGIVLGWPRSRAHWARLLAVNLRASATRIAFDLHRAAGALAALLLVLATLTGITLVYTNYVRDLVGVFSKVQSFPTVPWRMSTDETQPLSAVVDRLRTDYPRHTLTEIRLPAGQMSGWQFYLREDGDRFRLGDTIAWVHPGTGEVLVERSERTRTAGESFMHWLYPLHSGTAFGSAGMLAMCLTGLAPLLLVATGLWVWSRKRRKEKNRGQVHISAKPKRPARKYVPDPDY